MRKSMLLLTLALAVGLFASARAWAEETLMVSAAVSLGGALAETGAGFERENPGTKVVFNLGASGTLLQQLLAGGRSDLFATADQETMRKAAEKGLVDLATKRDFAANRLVLAVTAGGAARPKAAELGGPQVRRVAIGDPAFVPAGRYARRYLEGAALWGAVEPKLILGGNARQVLDYIARGEVDAGFVYATDAAAKKSEVAVSDALAGAERVLYPVAVLSGSPRKALAERFVAYLLGGGGSRVLASHGFERP